MKLPYRAAWLGVVGCLLAAAPARSQTSVLPADPQALNYYRPRVAVAPDGSFAVAWEVFKDLEFVDEWQIGVQRFSTTATPVGAPHFFKAEELCSTFDSWTADGNQNVEMAFSASGLLYVVMEHFGRFESGTLDELSSEITLGALNAAGQPLDLNGSDLCQQYKFIYPGADEQDRPRIALTANDELLLVMDGFFGGSDLRNVGLSIFDGDLNELFQDGYAIPHDDEASQSAFHMWPDVAINGNGTFFVTAWHACPIIDNQGNASECDVEVQFLAVQNGQVVTVGTNQRVNAGDPVGTLNWRPAVAMNAAGLSVVVWHDGRTGVQGDVFAQRYDDAGQAVGGNLRVSEGTGFLRENSGVRPEVAVLDDGGFMVVWNDSSAAGVQARGRQFSAAGTPLTGVFALDGRAGIESSFADVATDGASYTYVWGAEDAAGNVGVFVESGVQVVAVEPGGPGRAAPLDLQGYPNPFRTGTALRFELAAPAHVRLVVYDLLGREVALLDDATRPAGIHDVSFDAAGLPAGVYVARLEAGSATRTRLLVRAE